MTDNLSLNGWIDREELLPVAHRKVAVRGHDTGGMWLISGGVWWQPYKGQPSNKGRFMAKNERGQINRLAESDDVSHWRYV